MSPFPDFSYRIVLGEDVFALSFSWNARFAYWTLDIADNDGALIVAGRKLIGGHEVFEDLAQNLPVLLPLNLRDPLGPILFSQLGNDANVYTAV